VVFSSAEVTEESIRYQQNRNQIVKEFTRAVLDGQIQEGSFKSFAATSGARSDLIDIWYLEGLQTGDGFRIGLTSSFQQLGDVAVREIKGNLLLVLKKAPPKQSSQGAAGPGRARLTMLGLVLQPLGQGNLRIALATGDLEPAGLTRVRQLFQPLGQGDAAIAFGTGEPPGGQLIVEGEQVTLVAKTGSTLARFEFKGRNMQEAVQNVLDSDVAPPSQEAIARACGEGALSISNTNLFSAVWDFSQSITSRGQTTETQEIASLAAFHTEEYDCQTKKYTSSFMISFIDGSTDSVGIAVKNSPSSPRATPTPSLTPTPSPTPTSTALPAPAPSPTPTPTPTATPTPTPTPTIQPGSVLIEATSCTFFKRQEFFNGVDEEFDVTISGTVMGPVGSTFRLTWVITHAAPLGFGDFISSWSRLGTLSSVRRELGDPETGVWTDGFRVHTFNVTGQQRSGTVRFTASVTTSSEIIEVSETVTCTWQ